MSKNPLAAKVAAPYARALYTFSVENNIMHQITADFQEIIEQIKSLNLDIPLQFINFRD